MAVAALLPVTVFLGAAEAAESTAPKPLSWTSGPSLQAPAAERSPAAVSDGDGAERTPADRVLPAVGQLLHSNGGCSATVITSRSEQLALTAAHCVYIPDRTEEGGLSFGDAEPGWIHDMEFVPGRNGGDSPHGIWPVARMWVNERWQQTGDPHFDIAVVQIGEQDGRTIQDVVGSQGVDFNASAHDSVMVFGYPAEPPFDGTLQRRCLSSEQATVENGFYVASCQLTGGISGGPWLADVNDETGLGHVIAVTSGLGNPDDAEVYGVALATLARDLVQDAEADVANAAEA